METKVCWYEYHYHAVPTWTPYLVKVFSFLISIVLFSIVLVIVLPFTVIISSWCYLLFLFIDFILLLLSLYLLSFWWLYRRQLLYCCPPRIAQLIAGNIVLKYFTEYVKVCEMISATLTFHGPLTPELREVLGYTYF